MNHYLHKKWIIGVVLAIGLGFLVGNLTKNVSLYQAAQDHPRGSLNIPAQWLSMKTTVGWERMMLVVGYADNVTVCDNLRQMARQESPDRLFKCEDAN